MGAGGGGGQCSGDIEIRRLSASALNKEARARRVSGVPAWPGKAMSRPHAGSWRQKPLRTGMCPSGAKGSECPPHPERRPVPEAAAWTLSFLPAPRPGSNVAHLPGVEGSETAWTMSVDSASRTLVRNSFFLAPGQPEKNEACVSSHTSQNSQGTTDSSP